MWKREVRVLAGDPLEFLLVEHLAQERAPYQKLTLRFVFFEWNSRRCG